MTDTEFTSRVLGSAWPIHMNKAIAEDMHANMKEVGLPAWDEKDQALAKAVQREVKAEEEGSGVQDCRSPRSAEGGGPERRRLR